MVRLGLLGHSAKLTNVSRQEGTISGKRFDTALTEMASNIWRRGGTELDHVREDERADYGLCARKRRADGKGVNPDKRKKLSIESGKL